MHWDPQSGTLVDCLGPWSPWLVSQQEAQFRLQECWHRSVAFSLQHRPEFAGLCDADVVETRLSHSVEAQALLRVSLTGRFFTSKELHHVGQSEDTRCPFCGQEDSVDHRIVHCPSFQPERERVLEGLGCSLNALPPVQRCHASQELLATLDAVPWVSETTRVHGNGEDMHHLFVDGSCLLPRIPQLRLASWSVVLATAAIVGEAQVLMSGHLPTFLQTSYRSEIYAVLVAFMVAEASGGYFCIWSDCAGVLARVRKLQSGARKPQYLSLNSDLWIPVWQLLQQVQHRVLFRKVPAHDSLDHASDLVHEWAVFHNHAADAAAKAANQDRSDEFWNLWNAVRASLNEQGQRADRVLALHVAVGVKATQARPGRSGLVWRAQQCPPTEVLVMAGVQHVEVPRMVDRFGAQYIGQLKAWMHDTFQEVSENRTPVWVSTVELFFGFVLATRTLPPVYLRSKKSWQCNPHIVAALPRRCRWFLQQVTALAKHSGYSLTLEEQWPSSALLSGKFSCLAVAMPINQIDLVGRYMHSHLQTLSGKLQDRWRSIPLPEVCYRMQRG